MLSALSGLIYFTVLGVLVFRRPWVVMVGFFVFFTLTFRVVSAVYIDTFGPVYAEQLDRMLGPGQSAIFLTLAALIVVLFIAYVLRPQSPHWNHIRLRERAMVPRPPIRWPILVGAAFTTGLYIDLLRRGVIPLLVGMERFDYAAQYAGPLHHVLFEHGFAIASLLGSCFVRNKIVTGRYDVRYLLILLALFAYGVLTGHRFSAFFTLGTFFLLPCGAFALLRVGLHVAPRTANRRFDQVLESRAFQLVLALAFVAMIALTLANSFLNVREYGLEAFEKLAQRVLIQPSELWSFTWERLLNDELLGLRGSALLLFENPIDDQRNTGIQLLMVNALGLSATLEVLDTGTQYVGGYPEVFVEMLGGGLAWIPIVALAWITSLLLRKLCVAVILGHTPTVIALTYLYYAFSLHYQGGMLNFVLVWTFWAKVAAAFCAVLLDEWRERLFLVRRAVQLTLRTSSNPTSDVGA